jgi:hypothetical protein
MFWIEGQLGGGGGGGVAQARISERSIDFALESALARDYQLTLNAASCVLLSLRFNASAVVTLELYESEDLASDPVYTLAGDGAYDLLNVPVIAPSGAITIRVASQEAVTGRVSVRYQH